MCIFHFFSKLDWNLMRLQKTIAGKKCFAEFISKTEQMEFFFFFPSAKKEPSFIYKTVLYL